MSDDLVKFPDSMNRFRQRMTELARETPPGGCVDEPFPEGGELAPRFSPPPPLIVSREFYERTVEVQAQLVAEEAEWLEVLLTPAGGPPR